jgi:glycosyltransferase 2 family protein
MALPRNSKRRIVALTGIGITFVILAVFIVRLDWSEFIAAFQRVEPIWIFMTCMAIFVSVALRAIRWRTISAYPRSRVVLFWYATVLGYVGNMIYPARAGEAMRVIALCQSTQMGAGRAMASAFADRLADVFVLGTVALFVLGFQRLGPHSTEVVAASFFLAAVPILLFLAFVLWGRRFSSFVRKIAPKLPQALAARVPNWYAQALEQTTMIQKPSVLTRALALTMLATSVDYLAIWFGIRAMGWSLPPAAAVVVGILIAMGTMIPAAPGYLGIYQVACVLGLKLYGVSEAAALAFSIVLQVTVLSVIAVQGLATLAHYGWRIRDLEVHLLAANGGHEQPSRDGTASRPM